MTAEPPAIGGRTEESELLRLAAWVESVAGIHLPERKMALVRRRLGRRLRDLELSWGGYLGRVQSDAAERTLALDLLCTNETSFFREPRQFDLLETAVLPRWQREADAGGRLSRIRAWCAACASGEEPYSLAIALLDRLGEEAGWELDVLASDLSSRILDRAREAVFPWNKVEGRMPEGRLRRYFLRGRNARAGQLKVAPEVRALVRFQSINLVSSTYPVARGLDLIFCRNVLIYFRPERRQEVAGRLLALLRPGGLLFLGHAESLAGMELAARAVIPTVYERLPEAAAGAR